MAMSSLIISINRKTEIHCSGDTNDPCHSDNLSECISQLQEPDLACQFYITNVHCENINVQMPEILKAELGIHVTRPAQPQTMTDLTPKWTRVRAQIAHGKHVLTALMGGCVKLWELWPPTDLNMRIYERCCASPASWATEEGSLEHCCYALTTDDKAIYLPPGWIYATTTLAGGTATNSKFITASCLQIAQKVWSAESSTSKKTSGQSQSFVDAILAALDEEATKDEGLVVFCQATNDLVLNEAQKTELAQRLGTCESVGQNCGRTGVDHAPEAAGPQQHPAPGFQAEEAVVKTEEPEIEREEPASKRRRL
ncbi:hypothetical protein F5X68DRAFT_272569 [Plectosphaerella plurivora]|uniref:JmjC domain-containing protein n=1 Tax=Plectosphaerella plurivora TaxID=936078 RepID=A0A9P8VIT7_9PEZI|nr:hypothetical protein F5X68DRAFT_272569 [Plectosphaerella plurivora]